MVKWGTPALLLIAAIPLALQWFRAPIAIEPIAIDATATALGISGEALADQIKSRISEINSEAGELFQTRKLGDATVPLDVKIGGWDLTVEKLTKAYHLPLTSAHVTGHLSVVEKCVVLETATSTGDDVKVSEFRMNLAAADAKDMTRDDSRCRDMAAPEAALSNRESVTAAASRSRHGVRPVHQPTVPEQTKSLIEELGSRVECLGLRIVVEVSPDVAANYLFKRAEGEEGRAPDKDIYRICEVKDDIRLYSQVAGDSRQGPADRANALIGLSLVYSREHQPYEAVNMALAATELMMRARDCHGLAPDSAWHRFLCRRHWQWPFDKYRRAEVAAWMQLGAARSDYALLSDDMTVRDSRRIDAIAAFQHVIAVSPDYALAYDAVGLQQDARNNLKEAHDAFVNSIRVAETPAAHYDLGWLYVYHHDSYPGQRYWDDAEDHFRAAIRLKPDYWEAHRRLGYVLLENEKYREAIDVLKPAAEHAPSDGDLLRLLGSVYAGTCQFDSARQQFKAAYMVYTAERAEFASPSTVYAINRLKTAEDNQLNTLTDWGKVLDHFGLHSAAIAQEKAAVGALGNNIYALETLGKLQIQTGNATLRTIGIGNLKRAVDSDLDKHAFVIEEYLNELIVVGRVTEAIKAYEDWPWSISRDDRPGVRRSYAIALRSKGMWSRAAAEFQQLARLNIEFTKEAIGDLKAQATRGGADPATIASIESLEKIAVKDYSTHDCPDDSVVTVIKKAGKSAFSKQGSIQ